MTPLPCAGQTALHYSDLVADQIAAKRNCRSCPLRMRCLALALARREPYGVWGGTTPEERRQALDDDHLKVLAHTGSRLRSSRRPA